MRDNYPVMEIKNTTALTDMAASVLRPLIKVLMSNEFTHAELTELVRRSYVEVAYEAFSLPDKKMTYSRAAILTGLSRKEVVRLYGTILRQQAKQKLPSHQLQSHVMCVVSGWLSDLDYIDASGNPRQILKEGTDNSLATLVSKYCADASTELVFDELVHLGIVVRTSNKKLKLVRSDYFKQHDELEKIRIMSVCVSDLFGSAVQESKTPNGDIRFQRQLVYSGIEENLAHKLHEAGSEKAMALFDTLNEFLSTSRVQPNLRRQSTGKRVGLGIYYFEGTSQMKSVKMTGEEHA